MKGALAGGHKRVGNYTTGLGKRTQPANGEVELYEPSSVMAGSCTFLVTVEREKACRMMQYAK
eukprot:2870869-Pleurochrysis_carterae.AAC.1